LDTLKSGQALDSFDVVDNQLMLNWRWCAILKIAIFGVGMESNHDFYGTL